MICSMPGEGDGEADQPNHATQASRSVSKKEDEEGRALDLLHLSPRLLPSPLSFSGGRNNHLCRQLKQSGEKNMHFNLAKRSKTSLEVQFLLIPIKLCVELRVVM